MKSHHSILEMTTKHALRGLGKRDVDEVAEEDAAVVSPVAPSVTDMSRYL